MQCIQCIQNLIIRKKLQNIYNAYQIAQHLFSTCGWLKAFGTSVRGGSGMYQLDMKVSSVIFRASVF